MARRRARATRVLAVAGITALVAAAGVTAVGADEAGPSTAPVAAPTGSPTATSAAPLAPGDAASAGADAYVEGDQTTPGPTVPIVTVESTPNGPKVETHDVDSKAEARAVATDAARGHDLLGVDADHPVAAFGSDPVGVQVAPPLSGPTLAGATVSAGVASVEANAPAPTAPSPKGGGTGTTRTPPATSAAAPRSTSKTARTSAPTATETPTAVAIKVANPETSAARALANALNDPGFSQQWAFAKTTFLAAWGAAPYLARNEGGGITVAVVDTGVASAHPDLLGRVLPGHEFLGGGTIDRDVPAMTDNCGHGTHVAGTIAANPNNNIGVAGVAPAVKILPVRVLNCGGWSSDVAKGITWAANHGARVINLSVGGPGPDAALAQAIKYARSKGAVVVAAAGNNHGDCTTGKNATSYPGATTGAIGVGAIDSSYRHACFSNTGTYVDLAAPGVGIVSTYPPNLYASMDGTSMATPHVSAAAALVLARRPSCTPDRVELRLKSTANTTLLGVIGITKSFGAGLIDPAKAVSGPC